MSEIKVDTISKADGTEREDLAKGWLQYEGSGPTIFDSFNVASVTDEGVGKLEILWDTDFASANYSVIATGTLASTGTSDVVVLETVSQRTAALSRIITLITGGGTFDDIDWVCVLAFGDQT